MHEEADNYVAFIPKNNDETGYGTSEIELISKMHKVITIIQFKFEHEIIKRRSEFKMDHRLLLDNINYKSMFYFYLIKEKYIYLVTLIFYFMGVYP